MRWCESRLASKTSTISSPTSPRRSTASRNHRMAGFIDLLLHVDRYLLDIVDKYGAWVYALLFAIVYAETGLVVTPFLPGDSLLFAAGALAATGALDWWLLFGLLVLAAVAGNTVNYAIGRAAG